MNGATYRDEARVEHMHLALARLAEVFARITRDSFVEGNDAAETILYNLTILGEAANNVSREYCAAHPEVDFKDMAGLRHRLIHDYANIDMDRIWFILLTDVPLWRESVDALYATIPPPPTELPPNVGEFD